MDLKRLKRGAAALGLCLGLALSGVPSQALAAQTSPGGLSYDIVYRLYNPNSGEHFYTHAANEYGYLRTIGWRGEGTGWCSPPKEDTSKPIYRLYNPNAGDHHYTVSANEKDSLVKIGWRYEGILCSSAKEGPGATRVYRLYNPNCRGGGSHHYTRDLNERNTLIRIGWKDEGTAWFEVDTTYKPTGSSGDQGASNGSGNEQVAQKPTTPVTPEGHEHDWQPVTEKVWEITTPAFDKTTCVGEKIVFRDGKTFFASPDTRPGGSKEAEEDRAMTDYARKSLLAWKSVPLYIQETTEGQGKWTTEITGYKCSTCGDTKELDTPYHHHDWTPLTKKVWFIDRPAGETLHDYGQKVTFVNGHSLYLPDDGVHPTCFICGKNTTLHLCDVCGQNHGTFASYRDELKAQGYDVGYKIDEEAGVVTSIGYSITSWDVYEPTAEEGHWGEWLIGVQCSTCGEKNTRDFYGERIEL